MSCQRGRSSRTSGSVGLRSRRHLTVLKAAGLVTERREANRIYYSLVAERVAVCVGNFLSAVCPEQVVLRHKRGKTAGSGGKQ